MNCVGFIMDKLDWCDRPPTLILDITNAPGIVQKEGTTKASGGRLL